MATSAAATVPQYLAELPAERRAVVEAVLDVVRRRMPAGYEESMMWGGIAWSIPLSRYPTTYNKQPLSYAALAAQKHHYALYLMSAYADSEQERQLRDGFARAGRKLDIGKSCVRFKRIDDLALDVIGDVIASTPPDAFIAIYERARATTGAGAPAKSGAARTRRGGAAG
jgi:hypothetical protein